MSRFFLQVKYPVISQKMTLLALRAEAVARSTQAAHELGLTVTGAPTFHVRHGAEATITVTLPVAGTLSGETLTVEVE